MTEPDRGILKVVAAVAALAASAAPAAAAAGEEDGGSLRLIEQSMPKGFAPEKSGGESDRKTDGEADATETGGDADGSPGRRSRKAAHSGDGRSDRGGGVRRGEGVRVPSPSEMTPEQIRKALRRGSPPARVSTGSGNGGSPSGRPGRDGHAGGGHAPVTPPPDGGASTAPESSAGPGSAGDGVAVAVGFARKPRKLVDFYERMKDWAPKIMKGVDLRIQPVRHPRFGAGYFLALTGIENIRAAWSVCGVARVKECEAAVASARRRLGMRKEVPGVGSEGAAPEKRSGGGPAPTPPTPVVKPPAKLGGRVGGGGPAAGDVPGTDGSAAAGGGGNGIRVRKAPVPAAPEPGDDPGRPRPGKGSNGGAAARPDVHGTPGSAALAAVAASPDDDAGRAENRLGVRRFRVVMNGIGNGAAALEGPWLQLASFGTRSAARKEMMRLRRRVPETVALRRFMTVRRERDGDGRRWWTVRMRGFGSVSAAEETCARLERRGVPCLVRGG